MSWVAGQSLPPASGYERSADPEGSAVFNPNSTSYTVIKHAANRIYDDHYWAEDAIVMERNSRDFASRIQRINENAEAICEVLMAHPRGSDRTYLWAFCPC